MSVTFLTNEDKEELESKIAEAAQTGGGSVGNDQLSAINAELSDLSGDNYLPIATSNVNANGVTIVPDGSGYVINGTCTANKAYFLWNSTTEMPAGIKAGERYIIEHDSPVQLLTAIQFYDGSAWTSVLTNGYLNKNTFDVPANAVGMQVKFYVLKNKVYDNVAVTFELYSVLSNKYAMSVMGVNDIPKPMLTIVDDDGYKKFKTLLLPVIQAKCVPITSAVIGQYADADNDFAMNWSEIEECAVSGAEIMSHSYCHLNLSASDSMTKAEIQYDYQRMQNLLRNHGVKSEGLIFCGDSATEEKCVDACSLVYSYGLNPDTKKINYKGGINRYAINRYGISAANTTETVLNGYIDALASGDTGWMIWCIHTSDSGFQQEQADAVAAAIDYAIANNIEIVTVETGVRHYVI